MPFASSLGFYSEEQSFFLRGQDTDSFYVHIYMPRLCLWEGQTTIFSTSSCERLNFPALAKIRSYSVTFVRERLQLLRWFFTSTTHFLSRKNSSLSREEPQVIFALPAKEHLAGAAA